MRLERESLLDIATGAAFLGAGGGGDPHIGRLLAMSAIDEFGAPEIVSADSLDDDATVLPVGLLGVPTMLAEKAACGDDLDLVIERMEQRLGRKVDALTGIEIGGTNSLVPVMAAARAKLPLVDADGMGRAFPGLQMATFNVYGISCTPLVIADDHLTSLVVDAQDAQTAEELVRTTSMQLGAIVAISCYSMTGKDLKRTAVKGTLTLAGEIGRVIAGARKTSNPATALAAYLRTTPYYSYCKILFDGKVQDVRQEAKAGFNVGHCELVALDGSDSRMEVLFKNEHLIARQDGCVRAMVPDLICLVDRETAQPVPAELLQYGQRLQVIGTSAAPIMRTPESLAVFGPQAFGFDDPFVPLEEIDG